MSKKKRVVGKITFKESSGTVRRDPTHVSGSKFIPTCSSPFGIWG